MAGTPPSGFRADTFRQKIQFVFTMGQPPEPERQVTFYFTDTVTYNGAADGDNVPFDPTATVTRVHLDPVRVPCDVEFLKQSDEPTAFGVVVPARVVVTLLDVDYQKVKDASYIIVNGDRYLRQYEAPAYGLFDVGLHAITFVAENEH